MSRIYKLSAIGHLLPALLVALSCAVAAQAQGAASSFEERQSEDPVLREYRGVKIGMNASEVRQKLGDPKEKSDRLDLYQFSDNEMAQIYYDDAKKVMAVAVIYTGRNSNAPSAKAVLGREVQARADGSAHLMIRYPKAGYWVSYSRTAGDEPIVTVTMQRLNP